MAKHRLLYIPILFLFTLSFVDCAKRGTPSGGKLDSIAPVLVKSNPENYSINFKDKEIKIYFDEYIKFKNLQKELIISPPQKYAPSITPLSTSKVIKIKILDTLKENTTYSFNFGKSIVDNNEGNEFEFFKYVFSTGSYIDSLKLKGTVKDARFLELKGTVAVMLYEINEAYKDSIVFSEKPTYITVVKDSTNTFELTNLKAGKYLLMALEENNSNYTYQPQSDKIGFIKEYITLPTDSSYTLRLFKEQQDFKFTRPKHQSKHHIIFGFQGTTDSIDVDLLSEVASNFKYKKYRDVATDSLHFWFQPEVKADSLLFVAKTVKNQDTLTVRIRDLYNDTLNISAISPSFIKIIDTFKLKANIPIISFNAEKIKVLNNDSVALPTTTYINTKNNTAHILFDKEESQVYNIQILPEAITDFFEHVNDTLNYRVQTKALADYGTLKMTLIHQKTHPIIVDLIDQQQKIVASKYLTDTNEVFFNYITPGKLYIRISFDENKNGIWDSGNFLNKLQPEKVVYYPTLLDVRPNWDLVETFTLE